MRGMPSFRELFVSDMPEIDSIQLAKCINRLGDWERRILFARVFWELDITTKQERAALATLEDECDKEIKPKWKEKNDTLASFCGILPMKA